MASHRQPGPIVVTHEGGVRFAAQVRGHRVVVDQPPEGGGEDAGPMPLELLGTSLGTCIALYVRQFLHARGLPTDGMRVEVDQVGARSPSRIAAFVARVLLAAPVPAAYGEMLERVVRSCPAHNTLAQGTQVEVTIHAPAPAAT